MKTILLLILFATTSFAQVTQEWVRYYAGPENNGDVSRFISLDNQNNIIVTGHSDVGNNLSNDVATIKYDELGNQLWIGKFSRQPGSIENVNGMVIDQFNNIFITGYTFLESGPSDYFTAKYSSQGTQEWVHYYDGTGAGADVARDITKDQNNNVIVTGSSHRQSGSDPYYDIYTIKYDNSGGELWNHRYNGPDDKNDVGVAVASDDENNFYVLGSSFSSTTSWDVVIFKYNSTNSLQWMQTYNGPNNGIQQAVDVKSDNEGNIYVLASEFTPPTYNDDVLLLKYSASGSLMWEERYNSPTSLSDIPKSLIIDSNGDICIIGQSNALIHILKYSPTGDLVWSQLNATAGGNPPSNLVSDSENNLYFTSASNGNISIVKYDSQGNQSWSQTYTAGTGLGRDIVLDEANNIYVTGFITIAPSTNADYATLKYSQGGLTITSPLVDEKWIAGETDTIRWNGGQAGQFLQIDYSLDNGQTYITIDFAIPADSQYYVWNIPSTLLSTRSKIKLTDMQTSTELAVSDSFKVKGYVLTRLDENGQYVAFSSAAHGWSYPNGTLWPQSWFSQFQYSTATDPYTNEPYPNFFHSVPDSSFVDWPLWVEVFGEDQCYWFTQITGLGSSYKGEAQVKWKRHANKHRGSCFGFAASSFLAFNFPNQFFPRHPGIPNVSNIFVLNLTNTIQKVINGYFAYQFGKQSLDNDVTGITKDPRTTLIEVMNMFKNDVVDISTITIFRNPPPGSGLTRGAHTMAPISVTVDNTGASRYRVNLYDSNNPGLNTPYILVDSLNNTWQDFTGLGLFWNGSNKFYLEIPVSNYLNTPLLGKISQTKNQYVSGINNVEFYNTEKANIIYTASSGNKIGVINGNLINEIPNSIPIYIKNGAPSDPIGYYNPDDIYSVVMDNITDSEGNAYLTVFKEDLVYSYERFDADSLQTDRFYVDEGFSVFSNDNSEKLVNLTVIAEPDSIERIFFIRNSVLRQNDSVYIKELDMSDLVIKNYGEAKTYDLEINERSSQEEEVFSHPSISLPSITSHTIIPDWDDLDGSPIAILVDNGINGTIDDTLYVQNTVDVEDQGLLLTPNNYNLAQNYPNPFNPTTTIRYSIPQRSNVILKVYDILGKEVATIVNEEKDRGVYTVNFDATLLASGMYLYRIQAGSFVETKKMILIK